MSKITSPEPYRNAWGDLAYGAVTLDAIRQIRADIDALAASRHADERAPGTLHALRALLAGGSSAHDLSPTETGRWREVFEQWFDRVKGELPEDLRAEYRAHLIADLDAVERATLSSPPIDRMFHDASLRDLSRDDAFHGAPVVEALFQEAVAAANGAAADGREAGLPRLPSEPVADLQDPAPTDPVPNASPAPSNALRVTYLVKAAGTGTLVVDDFTPFATPEERAQGVSLTGADIEEQLRAQLNPVIAAQAHFDIEPSALSVTAETPTVLSAVTTRLLAIVAQRSYPG